MRVGLFAYQPTYHAAHQKLRDSSDAATQVLMSTHWALARVEFVGHMHHTLYWQLTAPIVVALHSPST